MGGLAFQPPMRIEQKVAMVLSKRNLIPTILFVVIYDETTME